MADPFTLTAIVVTFLLAGTVKGVVGIGLPAVSLALLTALLDLPTAMALMLVLIVLLARQHSWLALVLGSIALGISLFGISFYSVLTIKEIQLNRRQSNFVDSVTHELKTPIAALRLYLDTLLMRELSESDRREFYETMESELGRLDRLINQLLEVGRLDAIGSQTEPERVSLSDLLTGCAEVACRHHKREVADVFTFDLAPLHLDARRMLLEMIFGNLMDNAVKYGGEPPHVHVSAMVRGRDRIVIRVHDQGTGVPEEQRHKVFQLFFRGSDELQRTRKGTGLGLYIVRTLVGIMKGRVTISDGPDGVGSIFEVSLPGRLLARSADKPTESVAVHSTSTRIVEAREKTGSET